MRKESLHRCCILFFLFFLCALFLGCGDDMNGGVNDERMLDDVITIYKFKDKAYKDYAMLKWSDSYPSCSRYPFDSYFENLCKGDNYWELHGGYFLPKRDVMDCHRVTKYKWTELTPEIFENMSEEDLLMDEDPCEEVHFVIGRKFWRILGKKYPSIYKHYSTKNPIGLPHYSGYGKSFFYFYDIPAEMGLCYKDKCETIVRDSVIGVYIDAINKVIDEGKIEKYFTGYYWMKIAPTRR